jgi:hypothetical protein
MQTRYFVVMYILHFQFISIDSKLGYGSSTHCYNNHVINKRMVNLTHRFRKRYGKNDDTFNFGSFTRDIILEKAQLLTRKKTTQL